MGAPAGVGEYVGNVAVGAVVCPTGRAGGDMCKAGAVDGICVEPADGAAPAGGATGGAPLGVGTEVGVKMDGCPEFLVGGETGATLGAVTGVGTVAARKLTLKPVYT